MTVCIGGGGMRLSCIENEWYLLQNYLCKIHGDWSQISVEHTTTETNTWLQTLYSRHMQTSLYLLLPDLNFNFFRIARKAHSCSQEGWTLAVIFSVCARARVYVRACAYTDTPKQAYKQTHTLQQFLSNYVFQISAVFNFFRCLALRKSPHCFMDRWIRGPQILRISCV
jgi:hypothetical protein